MNKVLIRLRDDAPAGKRSGEVLNEKGEIIGSAHDSTYGGGAFAVHTKNWAGYTPLSQIKFVDDGKTA